MRPDRTPNPLPIPEDSPYRSEREAAAFLRVKPTTLQGYRLKGTGPEYSKINGRVIYDVAKLRAWVDKHARVSTTEAPEDGGATAPH